MFSRLETIFKTNFLPIKESDTRQDLTRDNKNTRRKNDEKNADEQLEDENHVFGDDVTIVSIAALHSFLNDLTHAPDLKHDFLARKDNPTALADAKQNLPRDEKTKRAISAYEHMAAESDAPPPPQKIQGRIDRLVYHLNDEEKNMIVTLITELDALKKRGVSELKISSSKNFLSGVVDAVMHEQSR